MSEPSLPKFPATPEEIKAASEKAMNFWVGALSPMWVPFWAASSFGLGAWALSQNMSKNLGEGLVTPDALLKDMPSFGSLATKWPGFTGMWGAYGASAEPADADETPAPVHSPVPVPEMFAGVSAAMAAAMVPEPPELAPEPAVEPEPVTETVAPVVTAPEAEPAAPKVVTPKVVTPKPIAQSVSAVKPRSSAKTTKPKT